MGKITLRKAFKKAPARVLNFLLLFSLIVPYGFFPKDVFAYTFPSTNELNKNKEVPGRIGQTAPYVDLISSEIGEVTLQFFNYAPGTACFEYRSDGESSQYGDIYPHPVVTDDYYYFYFCLPSQETTSKAFYADEYVEIRLAFGGERDWDFDWTKFNVKVAPTTPVLESPINNTYTNDNTPLMQWEDSSVTGGTIKGYYYRIFHHCTDSSDIPGSCSVFPNTTGLWRTTSEYQAGTTSDGTYYWQIKSVDMNDNESGWSELEKFTIDTINPTKPVFTEPENNLYTNINFIKLEWTGGDDTGSGVNGYTLGYTFTPANSGTEKTWNTGLREIGNPYWHSGTYGHGEGKYVFWVKTIDNAGNESETSELLTVTYDTVAPLTPLGLTIKNYRGDILGCNSYTNNRKITVDWNDSLETDFSHYIYGVKDNEFFKNLTTSSYTGNIRDLDGEYKYIVRAVDLTGNVSDPTDWCYITLDRIAPVVEITNPSDNQYVKGIVDFRGTVQDTNLLRYYYKIQNTTSATITTDTNLLDQTIYTWDTTAKSDGEYELRLEARDKADNKDNNLSVDIINVIVDNTSPTTEPLADFSIDEGSTIPTKQVLVEDNYELDEFCYSITSGIGDMPETCINPVGSTDSWDVDLTDTILTELSNTYGITTSVADTSIIPEGDYTISYFAKDKAGNESTPHTFIVTIENVVPTVLFSSSTTELLEGNSVSFNGSFTDPGLDDSDWTYTLSFGDGTTDVTGLLSAEGNIMSNYSHTYTNAGDYTASLQVCEDGGIICTTETIDISVGAVQGVTTGSSTTTTKPTTLVKKVTTYIADILGVGGEGDVLALEEDEETLEDDTEEVKGSQTCENPSTISGYIYIDSNENGEKDEGERVFSEISIRIYTEIEGMEETVKQIVTDENGYWETTLCTGDYNISVDDSKLPNNYVLEEDTLGVQVEEYKDSTLNFNVLDERNFLQKYWPWILLAVGILGSIGIVALDTRRKKEYI